MKYNLKKIFNMKIFLTLLFLITLIAGVTTTAYADSDSENGTTLESFCVNETGEITSCTESVVFPLQKASFDKETTFYTVKDAAAYLRAEMVNRSEIVTVTVKCSTAHSLNHKDLFFSAMEHTGVPNEGDYIYKHCGGYSVYTISGTDDGEMYRTFEYSIIWYTTHEMEKEMDTAISNLLSKLNLDGKDEYTKIKTLYDYICNNMTYYCDEFSEEDPTLIYTAYSALMNNTAVCQGFASLYYRLCLEAGIDCRVISGESSGENHAWNIVRIGNVYYNADSTWDLGLSVFYRYFICTENNFPDHKRDEEYDTEDFHEKYPMATTPYTNTVSASGKLNSFITWTLDGNTGVLSIVGTGPMPDFANQGAPWFEYHENITSIVISEGITTVGKYSFVRCKNVISVSLPSTLKEIKYHGFNNCRSLVSVSLPPSLVTLDTSAFGECSALKEITVPGSVKNFGSSVFSHCGIVTATLEEGITVLPDSMFYNCDSLVKINLPSTLTAIEDTVFRDCSKISVFTVPKSVTSVGYGVFSDCVNLENIFVEDGNSHFCDISGVFYSKDKKTLLCYPAKRTGSYTIPDGTVTVAGAAFSGATKLSAITFPETLTRIEDYAFAWCYSLKNVTVGKNVTFVGRYAFGFCEKLVSIEFLNPHTELDSYGICNCISLTSITLPANLTEIPFGFFDECMSLVTINIPESVKKIDQSAFYGCKKLTSITLPPSVNEIPVSGFRRCYNLKEVYVMGEIKKIGRNAFEECDSLSFIYFAGNISNVDSTAFESAPNITAVYFANSSAASKASGTSAYSGLLKNAKTVGIPSETSANSFIKNNFTLSSDVNFLYTDFTLYSKHTCTWKGSGTISTEHGNVPTGKCSVCNAQKNSAEIVHTYTPQKSVAPTCYSMGYTVYKCTACPKVYNDDYIPAISHSYSEQGWFSLPTCTEDGFIYFACEYCGDLYFETVNGSALGHSFLEYGYSSTCMEEGFIERECERCYYYDFEMLPLAPHEEVIEYGLPPTCTESGITNSSFCSYCGTILVSPIVIPAKGHSFGEWVVTKPATEDNEGVKERTCSACSFKETASVPKLEHVHDYSAIVTAPTCTEKGFTTHTCRCGDSYVDGYTLATGHSFGTWTTTTAPTCTASGTERRDCANCDHYETRTVPALGHIEVIDNVAAATCTASGLTEGKHCSVCGEILVAQQVISALGHTEVVDVAVEATCTTSGLTEGKHCSVCNEILIEQGTVAALGHNFAEEWTVDVEATTTSEGQKSRHCTRCDEITDIIVIAKLVEIIDTSKKFNDVVSTSWAKAGIDYVVSYGYMNGTGNGTTFSPSDTMTRAMIVSVLHRIAGKPQTTVNNPFKDLEAGQTWYHEAVLWAYENGIVTGTSATTFAPTGAVTREQMATFLFRFAKYMEEDVSKKADLSTFPDEGKVGSWAKDALSWANAEGLITGAKGSDGVTRLDPQGAATREQVATILMRFCIATE